MSHCPGAGVAGSSEPPPVATGTELRAFCIAVLIGMATIDSCDCSPQEIWPFLSNNATVGAGSEISYAQALPSVAHHFSLLHEIPSLLIFHWSLPYSADSRVSKILHRNFSKLFIRASKNTKLDTATQHYHVDIKGIGTNCLFHIFFLLRLLFANPLIITRADKSVNILSFFLKMVFVCIKCSF